MANLITAAIDKLLGSMNPDPGLRRLRALGRLWAPTPWALPASSMGKAKTLSRQLGYWRDQEALAWLPAKLRAAGGPTLPLPRPTPPPNLPPKFVAPGPSARAPAPPLATPPAPPGPPEPSFGPPVRPVGAKGGR